ncbi:hypothetical protein EBU71_19555, partial [bacterium]|nr:hypothetical protein [Candidatus Elulimicrobium humile]
LGTIGAETIVSSGAALDLAGYALGTSEALTLYGTGISTDGALKNTGGNTTYTGAITVGSATRIWGGTGTITLNGNILNNSGLNLGGTQGGTINGIISGTGYLYKHETGTWNLAGVNTFTGDIQIVASGGTLAITGSGSLSGTSPGVYSGAISILSSSTFKYSSSANQTLQTGVISGVGNLIKDTDSSSILTLSGTNTYSGGTTISAGTLKVNNATALGASSGAVSITSGAVLDLNGITMTNTNALTVNGTGITNGGAVINSNSTAATYAGLLTLGSASSIIGGTGTITLSNASTIAGSGFALILGGAQGGTVSSIIGTGTGTLTKQDAGTWTLSGANTYSGATTISGGTLKISADNNLGTAPVSATAGQLTLNGGILNTTANFTLNSNRGIALGTSHGTINTDTSTTLTYGGIIAGSNNLSKSGSGILILSGNSTYSGTTTISAGTLKLGATGDSTNTPLGTIGA